MSVSFEKGAPFCFFFFFSYAPPSASILFHIITQFLFYVLCFFFSHHIHKSLPFFLSTFLAYIYISSVSFFSTSLLNKTHTYTHTRTHTHTHSLFLSISLCFCVLLESVAVAVSPVKWRRLRYTEAVRTHVLQSIMMHTPEDHLDLMRFQWKCMMSHNLYFCCRLVYDSNAYMNGVKVWVL